MTNAKRCPSTHLGVPCRRVAGHDGKHRGIERGRWEHWAWTDDPNDDLVRSDGHTEGADEVEPVEVPVSLYTCSCGQPLFLYHVCRI